MINASSRQHEGRTDEGDGRSPVMRLSVVSDSHLTKDRDPWSDAISVPRFSPVRNARRVLEAVSESGADAVLHLGDGVDRQSVEFYPVLDRMFKETLSDRTVHFVRGNHDNLPAMRNELDLGPRSNVFYGSNAHAYTVEHGLYRLIVLDPLRHNRREPTIGSDMMAWFTERLDAIPAGHFAIVLLHHPAVAGPLNWGSRLVIRDGATFDRICGLHTDKISVVIHGHVHYALSYVSPSGVSYLSAPATSVAFKPSPNKLSYDHDPMGAVGFQELSFFQDGSFSASLRRITAPEAVGS